MVWLALLALAAELLVYVGPLGETLGSASGMVQVVALAAMLLLVVANWRVAGAWVIGLGIAMNLAVVAANGGHMPASVEAVRAVGQTARAEQIERDAIAGKSRLMTPETPLAFLGDVVPIPPIRQVLSPGDLVLGAGAFLVVALGCRPQQQPA